MPGNILASVDSWLYHLGDISSERMAEIAASGSDLIVIDFANYSGEETPYTAADLDVMRGGDDTLIVAYLSIGEAEDYRFYWDTPAFQAIADDVLASVNPEFDDNYKVKYWLESWQDVIFDYVDRIIDAGFNGLYLDIIDGFEYWEEEAPNSGIDYRQDMADFVAAIRAYAQDRLADLDPERNFVIIGQNGEALLTNETYLAAIDGVGKEDLYFYYDATDESTFIQQSPEDVAYSFELLQLAQSEGKPVFAVEYLTPARQAEFVDELASIAATLGAEDIPLYVAQTRDLEEIFQQPQAVILPNDDPFEIAGSAVADFLKGTEGKDVVVAGADNDQVWAGADDKGADIVILGAGHDIAGGGPGDDLLVGDGAASSVLAFDGAPDFNTAADGSDTLYGGAGNDTLLGGGWNDALIEANGQYDHGEALTDGVAGNAIWAGAGRDVIIGAAGRDSLGGGAGDDYIDGADGADILYGGKGDALDIAANDTLLGGAGDDTLFGSAGNDTLRGGAGDDLIFNGAGADLMEGGPGADRLWGGPGDDTIAGGAGADMFAFAGANGADIVTDFELDEDRLDLSQAQAGFASRAEVEAASSELTLNGQTGLLIDTGDGNSVFLIGVALANFSAIEINF